jgi:CRISPR-associated exonuclease Cas4
MKTIIPFSAVMIMLLLVAVVLRLLIRWACRLRLVGLEKAWLPAELRGAALVYMERVFRAKSPVPMVAKLDRGYRNAEGIIILVEFKTRRLNRPYLSDIIELSAQRLAMQAETGERVAAYGYVLIQLAGSERKTAHRVDLLSTENVIAMVRRREAILAGEETPRYASSERLCTRCAFKLTCKQRHGPFP